MDASRDENDASTGRAAPQFMRASFNGRAPHSDTINAIFSVGSGGWYRPAVVTANFKRGKSR